MDVVAETHAMHIASLVGGIAFAFSGFLVGARHKLDWMGLFFGFVTLAFLTAAGGGILRDILVTQVPDVLHSGFYGSIAILVAVAIYLLNMADVVNSFSLLAVFVAGLLLRLFAFHHHWTLPKL